MQQFQGESDGEAWYILAGYKATKGLLTGRDTQQRLMTGAQRS